MNIEMVKVFPILIHVISILLAATVIKLLYDIFIRNQQLKKSWNVLYEQLQNDHLIRKEEIEIQKKLHGESYKIPVFEKIDLLISYSGLQLQFPEFNGIIFVIMETVIMSLVVILTILLTKNIIYGLLAAVITPVIPYVLLKIRVNIQYEATKRDFTTFMRMVATYSGIYKDILTILDCAVQHVGNPIKEKVKASVLLGRADGNTPKALKWLWENMEYKLFKDLIKALEITSRNTLEYRKVIEEYMMISEKKNASMEKQKVIIRKGRMGILAMLILGVAMFYMVIMSVNGQGTLMEGINMFLTTFPGRMILGYLGGVVLGTLWYVFFKMRCE